METINYLDNEGNLSSACHTKVDDGDLVQAYQAMVLTRHIDGRMITLQRQGEVSFAMSSLGEEACAIGAAAALDFNDWIYPQYRELGVMFWRGFTPQEYVHHMFCNAKDLILGRQMPNHFGARHLNVVTVSSPIGTKIPHAAGCAYAMKVQKEPQVALVFFGEGAASEGDFHAGLNFAAVRRAPAIFFCRNNGYAISTAANAQFRSDGIAPRAVGYGIGAMRIDGNDFFAVYEAVQKAREICLKGEGPVLIEAMTYRMGAHSTSDDPTRYRNEKELVEWERKDPVKRLGQYLKKRKLWDSHQETKYEKKIQEEVTEAIEAAKKIGKPPLHSLVEDVYAEVPPTLQEQYEELLHFFPQGEK